MVRDYENYILICERDILITLSGRTMTRTLAAACTFSPGRAAGRGFVRLRPPPVDATTGSMKI